MAFNGFGTFTRLYTWVTDKANTVKITASRMDAEFDGIATGLSNCMTKDGQTTLTADIPFSSRKLTGLGDAAADTDAANRQTVDARIQLRNANWLTSVSGSDTITANASPTLTAYTTGQTFTFKAAGTGTGAATLNIDSVGATAIKQPDGTAIEAGDLTSGYVYNVTYDGTNFLLHGVYSEAVNEYADTDFRIQDNSDATKEIAFEASGITTGTTRTITVPDSDVDLGDIADKAVTATLASTSNGDGASLIGVEDTGGYYTGTDVEAVLQELGSSIPDTNQLCKAWVNYDQSVPAINDSLNISSVTDNGTGIFTANFTNDMDNNTYTTVGSATLNRRFQLDGTALSEQAAGSVDCRITTESTTVSDVEVIGVNIHGDLA